MVKGVTKSRTKRSVFKPKTKKQPKTAPVRKAKKPVAAKVKTTANMKRQPYPHQLEAAQFLLDKQKAILGDEMGAGKTLSAILALHSVRGKKLIVCPSSLKRNWKKEIATVSNDSVQIIEGKKWTKPSGNSWTVINYDILGNHMENIKKATFIGVAFDEAHFCKNVNNHGKPQSKRAKAFLRIANQTPFVFILTGTPITNKTKDIFNLLKAIKHPLSKDFKSFAQTFCNPVFNGFGHTYDGSSNQEQLHKELNGYMMRRLKKDLLDLPDKTRSFLPVDMDLCSYETNLALYQQQKVQFRHKGEHLAQLNHMRHELAKEKTASLMELTENLLAQHQPVVVFTNYTYVADAVKKRFKEAVSVTGNDKAEEREKAIHSFQSGDTDLIVCNLVAGGTGITLTRAKHMLVNDFDWVPTSHTQAEERIYRIGQEQDVIVEYLYAENTFDEKIADLLEEKLKNINKIMDNSNEGFLDEVMVWLEGRA